MTDDQKEMIDYILDGVLDRFEPIVEKFSRARHSQMMEFFESDHNHSYNANLVDGMYTLFEGLHAVADAIREKQKPKFEVDADGDPLGIGKKGGKRWN